MRHSSFIRGLLLVGIAQSTVGCSWLQPTTSDFPSSASQMVADQPFTQTLQAGNVDSAASQMSHGSEVMNVSDGEAGNALTNLVDGVSSLIPKPKDPEAELRGKIAAGRLLMKQKRYSDAEQLFSQLVIERPEAAEARQRLGLVIARQGRYEEAERHLAEATRLDPQNASVFADLGYLQYLQHRLPEAEANLRAALSLEPANKRYMNNLGLALGGQSRFEESFDIFRRAGSEAEAHANMGYVLAENGNLKGSQDAYLRALSLDNSMRKAAEAMLQVAAQEQNQQQAVAEKASPEAQEAKAKSLSSAIADNLDRAERRRRQAVQQQPARIAQVGYGTPEAAAQHGAVAPAAFVTPKPVAPTQPTRITDQRYSAPTAPNVTAPQANNTINAPQFNAAANTVVPPPIQPPAGAFAPAGNSTRSYR